MYVIKFPYIWAFAGYLTFYISNSTVVGEHTLYYFSI